jgi:hypothetical protein
VVSAEVSLLGLPTAGTLGCDKRELHAIAALQLGRLPAWPVSMRCGERVSWLVDADAGELRRNRRRVEAAFAVEHREYRHDWWEA